MKHIPVIDLFAGPGGLCEGFSQAGSTGRQFEVVVSIEKDAMAAQTLRLRAAHRSLHRRGVDEAVWRAWEQVIAESPWDQVFVNLQNRPENEIVDACRKAEREAWQIELGESNRQIVSEGIRARLKPWIKNDRLPNNIVLIGGPPCQAYSVVGRARNKGVKDYKAENDHRHFLYREYLAVINEFRPAIFVMENVKGILTSRVDGDRIFETIRSDLARPDKALGQESDLGYMLVALPEGMQESIVPSPESFIVRAEHYGIPQARHRVIICGVRKDVFAKARKVDGLEPSVRAAHVRNVLSKLPQLRPEVSYRGKGTQWFESLSLPILEGAITELYESESPDRRLLAERMRDFLSRISSRRHLTSGKDRSLQVPPKADGDLAQWFCDRQCIKLLTNHESRSHMPEDIARYFFVAAFGAVMHTSPRIHDFPPSLLPKHKNIDPDKLHAAIFKDRFRVQLWDQTSTTVTSHIGKDGHAFIHPDPLQCRSLSVREAARLQTFPDSYVFLGARTSQYSQVGNAVPPLLAKQIADVVLKTLGAAGY